MNKSGILGIAFRDVVIDDDQWDGRAATQTSSL